MLVPLRRAAWLAGALLVTWFALSANYLTDATFTFEVDAVGSGSSRIHVPIGRRSRPIGTLLPSDLVTTAPLPTDAGSVSFTIPPSTPWLRWEPDMGRREITVGRGTVSLGPFRWAIGPERLRPGQDGTAIERAPSAARLTSAAEGAAVSVLVPLPQPSLQLARYGVPLGAAAALILAALFGLREAARLDAGAEAAARLWSAAIRDHAIAQKLAILVAIASVFYLVELTSFSISIDDEFAALRTDHEIWVAQGRFSTYLLERFVLTQPVVPFLPTAIFILCASASYLCVLSTLRLPLDARAYAAFPIFCAYPVWMFVGEFYANLPSVGLGLVLVSLAARMVRGPVVDGVGRIRDGLPAIVAAAALVAIATGFYQSLLIAFAALCLAALLRDATRDGSRPRWRNVRAVASILAACAGASLLYVAVSRTFLTLTGTAVAHLGLYVQPRTLIENPAATAIALLREIAQTYLGSPKIFGVGLGSLGLLTALGCLTVLGRRRPAPGRYAVPALASLLLVTPFALNVLAGPGVLPMRALVALPVVVCFFAILALSHHLAAVRAVAYAVAALAACQLAYASSSYQATQSLVRQSDHALAADLYRRIMAAQPGSGAAPLYRVAVFGGRAFSTIYPTAPSSLAGVSLFTHGEADRILSYMKLAGFSGLRQLTPDERRKRWPELRERLAAMPSWPAPGAVVLDRDVFLVKLGEPTLPEPPADDER